MWESRRRPHGKKPHLPLFPVLHDGLYYLNSAEWALPAVEMSAVAGRNAANAAFEFWRLKSKEVEDREKNEDGDDEEEDGDDQGRSS